MADEKIKIKGSRAGSKILHLLKYKFRISGKVTLFNVMSFLLIFIPDVSLSDFVVHSLVKTIVSTNYDKT